MLPSTPCIILASPYALLCEIFPQNVAKGNIFSPSHDRLSSIPLLLLPIFSPLLWVGKRRKSLQKWSTAGILKAWNGDIQIEFNTRGGAEGAQRMRLRHKPQVRPRVWMVAWLGTPWTRTHSLGSMRHAYVLHGELRNTGLCIFLLLPTANWKKMKCFCWGELNIPLLVKARFAAESSLHHTR